MFLNELEEILDVIEPTEVFFKFIFKNKNYLNSLKK
jgi:hypothetical protein